MSQFQEIARRIRSIVSGEAPASTVLRDLHELSHSLLRDTQQGVRSLLGGGTERDTGGGADDPARVILPTVSTAAPNGSNVGYATLNLPETGAPVEIRHAMPKPIRAGQPSIETADTIDGNHEFLAVVPPPSPHSLEPKLGAVPAPVPEKALITPTLATDVYIGQDGKEWIRYGERQGEGGTTTLYGSRHPDHSGQNTVTESSVQAKPAYRITGADAERINGQTGADASSVIIVEATRVSDGARVELYRDYRGMWREFDNQPVRDARQQLDENRMPASLTSSEDWAAFDKHQRALLSHWASLSRLHDERSRDPNCPQEVKDELKNRTDAAWKALRALDPTAEKHKDQVALEEYRTGAGTRDRNGRTQQELTDEMATRFRAERDGSTRDATRESFVAWSSSVTKELDSINTLRRKLSYGGSRALESSSIAARERELLQMKKEIDAVNFPSDLAKKSEFADSRRESDPSYYRTLITLQRYSLEDALGRGLNPENALNLSPENRKAAEERLAHCHAELARLEAADRAALAKPAPAPTAQPAHPAGVPLGATPRRVYGDLANDRTYPVGTALTDPRNGTVYTKIADPADVRAGVPVERRRHVWRTEGQERLLTNIEMRALLER